MKTLLFAVLSIALLAPAFAQTGRVGDKDLKKVWETVDKDAGKFRDAVGSKLQSVTNAAGETVDIQQTLKDFDSVAERLKDQFSSGNESNSDVEAFLKQAAMIDRGMTKNPNLTDATSEWQLLRQNLDQIVKAYHVSWEWNENSPHPFRMHDMEVEGLVMRIGEGSKHLRDQVKDSVKKDTNVDKATRTNVENAFKTLEKQAETLKKRIHDGQPVSAELSQLMSSSQSLKELLAPLKLNIPATSGWSTLQGNFATLAKEYGLPAM